MGNMRTCMGVSTCLVIIMHSRARNMDIFRTRILLLVCIRGGVVSRNRDRTSMSLGFAVV